MSSGQESFLAYIQELIHAGKQFSTMAIGYRDAMPNAGFEQADGGNSTINGMLDTSVRMVGELHLMIAQAMYVHGEKIVAVAERYEQAEDNVSHNVNVVLQDVVSAVHHPTSLPPTVPSSSN